MSEFGQNINKMEGNERREKDCGKGRINSIRLMANGRWAKRREGGGEGIIPKKRERRREGKRGKGRKGKGREGKGREKGLVWVGKKGIDHGRERCGKKGEMKLNKALGGWTVCKLR